VKLTVIFLLGYFEKKNFLIYFRLLKRHETLFNVMMAVETLFSHSNSQAANKSRNEGLVLLSEISLPYHAKGQLSTVRKSQYHGDALFNWLSYYYPPYAHKKTADLSTE
jgi:hypothetical protein